jgi:hypothetical protein
MLENWCRISGKRKKLGIRVVEKVVLSPNAELRAWQLLPAQA